MSTWYRKIKPPRSKAARLKDATRYVRRDVTRIRKPPTIRPEKQVFWRTYSNATYVNGYKSKTMSRWHVAKLFDVPLSTIHKWDKAGALPEAFMYLHRGNVKYPVYLSAQIRCLLVVVRDLVGYGYVSIPWNNLPEHLDMLADGYEAAAKAHQRRMSEPLEEKAGKFGVIFDV